MSEMDQRTSNAIARLRREWSPPSGSEDRMLADFHARLEPPDDGGDDGDLPGGGEGGLTRAGGQWIYVGKIVGAVVGLTAVGLGGLVVAAKLARTLDRPPSEAQREPVVVVATNDVEVAVEPEPAAPPQSEQDVRELENSPAPSAPPKPKSEAHEPSPQVDLAAELALIQQARAAEPEAALELLDQHAREFPKGALSSEREALRAVASCALDRVDDARASVERFVALDPGPLLRKRVQAACGKKLELPTTESDRSGDSSL